MSENDFNFEDDGRYYTELAAAFVRGRIGGVGEPSPEELIRLGKAQGCGNFASIALLYAPRTMRESALFMSKPGRGVDRTESFARA